MGKSNKYKFYEVQQLVRGQWVHLGFFKEENFAIKYSKEFNTGVELYKIRVEERKMLDDTVF